MNERAWCVGTNSLDLQQRDLPRRNHPDPAELLAWDLVEAARPALDKRTRNSLFVALGAGESGDVIAGVLRAMPTQGHDVSLELVSRVAAWLDGYVGVDDERVLRELLGRVAASTTTMPLRTNEEPNGLRQ